MYKIFTNILFFIITTYLSFNGIFASNLITIINATINNIDKDQKGVIYLQVCNKQGFIDALQNKNPKNNCMAAAAQHINNITKKYTFTFSNINTDYKEIAIFGYIDENLNGTLDYNDMGIPTEPVLFTVQLKREPNFNDVKTVVNKTNQDIILFAQ